MLFKVVNLYTYLCIINLEAKQVVFFDTYKLTMLVMHTYVKEREEPFPRKTTETQPNSKLLKGSAYNGNAKS